MSTVFRIMAWCLGVAVTFMSFSWLGLFIGLALFRVGVVLLGIVGAFFSLKDPDLGVTLLVTAGIGFGLRVLTMLNVGGFAGRESNGARATFKKADLDADNHPLGDDFLDDEGETGEWWYDIGGTPKGPVSSRELQWMRDEGIVDSSTIVITDGMQDWQPIGELDLFGSAEKTPRFRSHTSHRKVIPASRWTRFFARMIDVVWETWLLEIVFVYGHVRQIPLFGWLQEFAESLGAIGRGLIYLPMVFVLDAVVYQIFDNTPGKALAAIHVRHIDGRPLRFREYIYRNLKLWMSGLGLGIPIVQLFTMAHQADKVKRGEPTSYDSLSGFAVFAKSSSRSRKIVTAMIFLTLVGGTMVLGILANTGHLWNDEYYTWRNPRTGITADVNAIWRTSTLVDDETESAFLFEDDIGRALVTFGVEYAPVSLEGYAQLFQLSNSDVMRLDEGRSVTLPGNRSGWRVFGAFVDLETGNTYPLHVTTFKDGNFVWRVVSVRINDSGALQSNLIDLEKTLWETVYRLRI